MSYTVLARRWRPRQFSEVVGQPHIVKALQNALENDRVHHAFLFTGTRGVGKTTLARILSKALNCLEGVKSEPCGKCAHCVEIDEGRFLDLIEVDAASRTKVEDTRDLLDNVQYAPTKGRYKVYLIDEVHMLSKHSFNALLKTLEEPPEHVKFLLATTDPQKIPVTVLSRCLQFSLKKISVDAIAAQLQSIVDQEKVAADAAALTVLARAAEGSMRDALSLLDQTMAYSAGNITESAVRDMLGLSAQHVAIDLLKSVAARDIESILGLIEKLDDTAPDYQNLLADLASLIQHIALSQHANYRPQDVRFDDQVVTQLAAALSAEDCQLFYQIVTLGRDEIERAWHERGAFEMLMLRLVAFRPFSTDVPSGPAAGSVKKKVSANKSQVTKPATKPAAKTAAKIMVTPKAALQRELGDWQDTVNNLSLSGGAKLLANHCELEEMKGNTVMLRLAEASAALQTPSFLQKIKKALASYLGRTVNVEINIVEAAASTPAQIANDQAKSELDAFKKKVEADPNVVAIKDMFGATLEAAAVTKTSEDE